MLATLRVPLAVAVISFIAPSASEAQRGGGAVQLPEGPGKDIVQKRCVTCHPLGQIAASAGYDQAGWKHVIESMMVLPADQMTAATEYLATHFPEKPGRQPTLVPGPVKVTFKEWMVPTLGQRSRDDRGAQERPLAAGHHRDPLPGQQGDAHRRYGRARWSSCFRPRFATRRCRCRITSAMAGSAASFR